MRKNLSLVALATLALERLLPDYFGSLLDQRLAGIGSRVEGYQTREELKQALLTADWEEYSHEAVAPDCRAFKTADIKGVLGVVDLRELPVDMVVHLDDPKGTGKVQAHVKMTHGPKCDYTVAILGHEQGEEVLFTFHPGDPVRPSQVEKPELNGRTVVVSEALELGFTTAKVIEE